LHVDGAFGLFAACDPTRAAFANWSTGEQDIPIILNALEECAKRQGIQDSSIS
jgi:hypothetical protein